MNAGFNCFLRGLSIKIGQDMTDEEFDVLDAIYFVAGFEEIKQEAELSTEELVDVLIKLWEKDWLRCLVDKENDIKPEDVNIRKNYNEYYFLASKKGLLAHNGV